MALTLVTTGANYKASDVNSILNLLQQPSGGTETGGYHVQYGTYVAGGYICCSIRARSQLTTIVSMSVDLSGGSTNCGNPTTYHIGSYTCQLENTATAAGTTTSYGGGWTIQY